MSTRQKNRRLVKFMEWISDINATALPAPQVNEADVADPPPTRSRRSISFGSMNPIYHSPKLEASETPLRRVIQFGELPVTPSSPAVAMPKVRRARPVIPTPPRETMSPSTPESSINDAATTAVLLPAQAESVNHADTSPVSSNDTMEHHKSIHLKQEPPNLPYIPVPDGHGGYYWMPATGYPHPPPMHPSMGPFPVPPPNASAAYYPHTVPSFSPGTQSSASPIEAALVTGMSSYPMHPMASYAAPVPETGGGGEAIANWCPPSPPSGHLPYVSATAAVTATVGGGAMSHPIPPPMMYPPPPHLSQAPISHPDSGYWIDPITGMCIPAMAPAPGAVFDPNMPPPPPHTSGHFTSFNYPYPMPYGGYPNPMAHTPAGPMPVTMHRTPDGGTLDDDASTNSGIHATKIEIKASAPEFVPGRRLSYKQQQQQQQQEYTDNNPPASLQTPPLSATKSDYSSNNELPMES
ncbi:hypothetical protein BDF22DRAFT_743142 [Syncephalis plumigaleata]|nr:hypothetical protein BDF22DRAFT_743142 [Syncephalis plumigaleata]